MNNKLQMGWRFHLKSLIIFSFLNKIKNSHIFFNLYIYIIHFIYHVFYLSTNKSHKILTYCHEILIASIKILQK